MISEKNYQGNEPEHIREKIAELGREIKGKMAQGWGFTLLMYDYHTDDGSMVYLSSANREDMIKALREFIANAENAKT